MKTTHHLFATFILGFFILSTAVVQGQDFTYETNNGTITITGYTGPGGDVVIPEAINGLPVTSIGDSAFYGRTSLTNVVIGNSVTSIGDYAFSWCSGLTSVMIGNSVTSIGGRAFESCTGLNAINVEPLNPAYSSVDGVLFNQSQTTLIQCPQGKVGSYSIPRSVNTIEGWAFSRCIELTSVTIPGSVTNWLLASRGPGVPPPSSSAFYGCSSLASVTIAEGVPYIPSGAFSGCTSLSSITIPNSVTSIGDGAFGGCSSLTNITIPNSVTSIGDWAFIGCTSLSSITIPNSVISIGNSAFYSCESLTSITIPNSVTSIGIRTFEGCTSLTSVTIPNSVTSIGDWAFIGCTSLTNVTIPDSVTDIGDEAFEYCSSLISITIPNNVTNIGEWAFCGCGTLTAIIVDALNPVYASMDGVLFNKSQTTLIQFPGGKSGSYTIPSSVTSIGDRAFLECSILAEVVIPDSVTTIGTDMFRLCTSLTGVYFNGNAPSLGSDLFYGDTNTVYYLPGTRGWGSTFGGRPTALWSLPSPVILKTSPSFGVQTNGFGFIISWATNIPVVVEACSDLANPTWSSVGTNTLSNGSAYFSDAEWANHPARFYRIRQW